MTAALTTVRNIGPAMESALRSAGIASAEELRALGPDAAYSRMVETGHRPHFIAYYSLVMGLQGRPWNDCRGQEKAELRKRFDGLVANASAPDTMIARTLDEIGVRLVAKPGRDGTPS